MKATIWTLLFVSAFAVVSSGVRADEPKMESIFNGKDLTGWKAMADKSKADKIESHWQVKDGILISQSDESEKGSLLETEKKYKNCVIELDARWNGEVDSGVFVRKPDLQMQIGISRKLKKDMTCSFYVKDKNDPYPVAGQGKDVEKILKVGDWNHFRLECKDNTFTVSLNGKKVTEYTSDKYPDAAPIALQVHPAVKMRVDFKDIKVGEIKSVATAEK